MAVNQLGKTDFTYQRVIGWGWFYPSTMLDNFSRYILAWKLCTTMIAADVTETLPPGASCGRASSGYGPATAQAAERYGPSYLPVQLGACLQKHGMCHTRGQPYHPMKRGKIERYYRSLKNRILLEHYICPGSSKRVSRSSSASTTTVATMRACAILLRPIATLGADQSFSQGGKRSNTRPPHYDNDCISKRSPEPNPVAHSSLIYRSILSQTF